MSVEFLSQLLELRVQELRRVHEHHQIKHQFYMPIRENY